MSLKIVDFDRPVTSAWLLKEGRRFDAGPFLGGAVEARILLEKLRVRKDPLRALTKGHNGGIYMPGRNRRVWVTDPEHGTPYLTTSSILQADLSNLPLIANRLVKKDPLLIVHRDMTLVTRSGTIGRMAYCRGEMDGLACSEDVLRVVPDPDKIPPGYLYAFLSSKYGVPLVVSGTYGAIIQHIEPEHIAELPVPRLGDKVEETANDLVFRAAALRSSAAGFRGQALTQVEAILDWEAAAKNRNLGEVPSTRVQRRLDAFHHSAGPYGARMCLEKHHSSVKLIGVVSDVYEPNRGARRKVEDTAYGVPFLSSSALFRSEPDADYLVSSCTKDYKRLEILERDLLLPRSGQVGGIIGRAVLPLRSSYGSLGSEHLVRVRARSREDCFALFAVLASTPGYLALVGTAFGSSIPSLDAALIASLNVPWFDRGTRTALSELVGHMVDSLSDAEECDRQARRVVERGIEESSGHPRKTGRG